MPAPPTEPFTYNVPENRIFICDSVSPWDECLESKLLGSRIDQLKKMVVGAGLSWCEDASYILDIDLDFFRTKRSIDPSDTAVFYRLLRGATAITIALEPQCVSDGWEDEEVCDGDFLLQMIFKHIGRAIEG